jgi:hypothetical protein
MANKYISLVSGELTEVEAIDTSAGAADVGKIPALDSAGRLDLSFMPVGVGPDSATMTASENIAAGDYINIHDSTGAKIRKADNSNGRPAHGFVKDAILSAASGLVYFEGINDDQSGLTIGGRCYLGTGGAVTQTAPTFAGGATISQFLGVAISATEINTEIADHIGLA